MLLALIAAFALLLFGDGGVGRAQTAIALIEVEGGGDSIGFEGERALGFKSAASAGTGYDGWVVTRVELRIKPDVGTSRTATPPGLAICEADSDGDPTGTCYPLRAPGRVQIPAAMTNGQEVRYRAPGPGHFLATGSNYTLHFTENDSTNTGDIHNLVSSTNDGEAVSVAGTFKNAMRELKPDGTWGGSSTDIAWARITGFVGDVGDSPFLVSNVGQALDGESMLATTLD